jgi:dihydroflavonol-4-reductase
MNTFLVTGPTGFLGYHVVKRLNTRGDRPRVLLPAGIDPETPGLNALKKLHIDMVEGDVDDPTSLRTACDGVDVVYHLSFTIGLGGGKQVERSLYEGNVVGTRNILEAAAERGVSRVVVSSSSLTVGLNHEPQPLDEGADWDRYAFNLPYALSRRQAEQEALSRPPDEPPEIVVVNPSFTLGPEDLVGAPANKLVMKMSKPGFRITAPIGFGVLDVRDYADGVLRAAERGIPGQRYILSGANVTSDRLLREVTEVVGIDPARWLFPLHTWILRPVIALLGLWSKLKGTPPKISSNLLELWGRYAWYDTSHARSDLGWEPRPLRETIQDTLRWMQDHGVK